ncbi:metallophosphoesterase family protein [Anianabacter salinae]|uniref:metallophosphoesterase family protein n=1 Tax=Anianabacter salinae TaxID=2851023 RepID=UPI00225E6F7C|nr:metallophosphoesterase family protein [Anianabacter salinae]MBV0913872.1 metallophosphoesterase [Anianabacter salinae]
MTRLVHLSDLHFGRDRDDLADPLIETVNRLAPDMVVVSGDFTQRARVSQFDRARRFLNRLEPPVFAVPGNHDTPLDNVLVRFLRPWVRYREAIAHELEPRHDTPDLRMVGINTVNRFSWQRGRFRGRHRARVAAAFSDAGERVRVVVLHHPLEHGPETQKRLMKGAGKALRALEDAGADIVLSGHLHNAFAAPFLAAPGLLFVQAGTGLSTRLRGETNTFNLLTLSRARIGIEVWRAGADAVFAPSGEMVFDRAETGWKGARPRQR